LNARSPRPGFEPIEAAEQYRRWRTRCAQFASALLILLGGAFIGGVVLATNHHLRHLHAVITVYGVVGGVAFVGALGVTYMTYVTWALRASAWQLKLTRVLFFVAIIPICVMTIFDFAMIVV
jgi:hypothetical protein